VHSRRLLVLGCLLGLAACSPFSSSGCDPTATVDVKHDPLPTALTGKASFDALAIDQQNHMLFVADRTDRGVDVWDVRAPSPQYVRTLPVGGDPNGLALAPDLNKLYVGVGNGTLAVITTGSTPTVAHSVDVKSPVDLIDYDPQEKKVYGGADDHLVVVDATKDALVTTIKLQKGLEQPRYNPADKMVYVTGSDRNELYQVDPVHDRLVKTYSIDATCKPAGIAINTKINQALLACTSTQTLVWDLKQGHRTTLIDQATGGDIAIYDDRAGLFFVAQPAAKGGAQVGIFEGSPIKYRTAVALPALGGGVAYDEAHDLVYATEQDAGKVGLYSFKPPAC
jgi:DNA-binding beta-propeller fold protein YncE